MSSSTPKHLTDHFTPADATFSQTAERRNLNNEPTPDVWAVIQAVAVKMEKLRVHFGDRPINISSWYRSPQVNLAVGSTSHHSQHTVGEAIDFTCSTFGTPAQVCKFIVDNQQFIMFDQLILEHTWVHISFAILSRKPRGQVLSLLRNGSYAKGLTDKDGKPLY